MYHQTDVHIGRKLRVRRVATGLSQVDLADKLGISFQQVQKYESGANRISGSRMWDLACILESPVAYFFDGLEDGVENSANDRSLDRQTLELARAVNSIEDTGVKTQLVRLVKAFAKSATPLAAE